MTTTRSVQIWTNPKVPCKMLQPDSQLLADARKVTTGANVHDVATLVAYYVNELEIYNKKPSPRALDCVQALEFGLRKYVYGRHGLSK